MEQSWKEKGYCIDHHFFDSDYLENILSCLNSINFTNTRDFGSEGGKLEFPSPYDVLNKLTLHPRIITSCQKLLGTDDIRLIQSDIWLKQKNYENITDTNADQRMHMDFPNNYLTHPKDWYQPESVAIIIYFSDSSECGGETALVERIGDCDKLYQPPFDYQVGVGIHPWVNNKERAEKYFLEKFPGLYNLRKELYTREKKIPFRKGTILFYRHDLWHRGTPTIPGKSRIVMNLSFKKAGCDYITCWNKGFARSLADSTRPLERLIPHLDNQARKCLGFPDEGDTYWDQKMKSYFQMRYQARL